MKVKFAGLFIVAVGLLCVIPVAAYIYFMWYRFGFDAVSSSNSDWGSFGSYLGGILSPLFTLVSIAFIYYSIRENSNNHKNEMRYLKSQQTISMVGALGAAFNAKLDSAVNLAHPLLAGDSISVYEECQVGEAAGDEEVVNPESETLDVEVDVDPTAEVPVFQVEKSKMKLAELLEDYMFYRDPKRIFNWQYVNLVNALTYDVVDTLGVALDYCSAIEERLQRKEAVIMFSAETNSTKVTALLHLLADRIKYSHAQDQDIADIEEVFASAAILADLSDNYKYSSVPFLKLLLYKLIEDGFRNTSDKARFEFNREGSATIVRGQSVVIVPAKKVFDENDVEVDGVKIRLNGHLRTIIPDFRPSIDVSFSTRMQKYQVEIQAQDALGLSEILGVTPPLYKLTFSLVGLVFNLDELEVVD